MFQYNYHLIQATLWTSSEQLHVSSMFEIFCSLLKSLKLEVIETPVVHYFRYLFGLKLRNIF